MNITDLFIIIWLLVMGIIDIKKKAVPLALLIIFSVMSILLKLVSAIRDRQQIETGYFIFILIYAMVTIFVSVWGQMLGMADMIILGVLSFLAGIQKAVGVLLMALFLVSISAVILLVLKRVKAKDRIAFIPYMFLAYLGDIVWVRASYTVENAVIIPIFSMIIIIIISFTCSIHDEIIKENVISQTAIENELNDMSIDRKNEFEKIAEGFLKERCIFSHDYEVRVDNSSIKKSEPEKSIRIMRAIMEAID